MSCTRMTDSPFDIFSGLPDAGLSPQAKTRLREITKAHRQHPKNRSALIALITANAHDPARGIYMALSDHPKILNYFPDNFAEIPDRICPSEGSKFTHFLNPLMLPTGGIRPALRATNAGFLIVTHEFDGESAEGFEETLNWSRDGGPFEALHRELCRYKDYRGYSIVFTGRRSLHLHFLFDTKHLVEAPYQDSYADRMQRHNAHASIMSKAYLVYWDFIDDLIQQILAPSHRSDEQLRKYSQWRRTPVGLRKLEKPSPIMGWAAGTDVPQIVIQEKILTRAAPNSTEWIVDEHLSPTSPLPSKSSDHARKIGAIHRDDMVTEGGKLCEDFWGVEYPKLHSIEQSNGGWKLRFLNHDQDAKPGTYVGGNFKKLALVGSNVPGGDFFLPDGMTANEFGDYLAILCGHAPVSKVDDPALPAVGSAVQEASTAIPPNLRLIERLRIHSAQYKGIPFIRRHAMRIERDWALPMRGLPQSTVLPEYRAKLHDAFRQCDNCLFPSDSDWIIMSTEGIGKTTTLMSILARRAFCLTMEDRAIRFSVFACRSLDQAKAKAQECAEKTGMKTVVIQSLWTHYREECDAEGVIAIRRHEFTDRSTIGILREIKELQPKVYDRLEHIRKSLWSNGVVFDSMETMIFTTHATAFTWHHSQITRIWHHPRFRPLEDQNEQELREEFVFANVVVDEFELDDIVSVLSEPVYQYISDEQQNIDWRHSSTKKQYDSYLKAVRSSVFDPDLSFESYDELMRIDLDGLVKRAVDFDFMPFGHDNKVDADGGKKGIYRDTNGSVYHLGPKAWLRDSDSRWTFLTTEPLVTSVLERVYKKVRKTALVIRLDDMPDIYPLKVAVFIDPRAGADRADGRPKISALAHEILDANDKAVVVADGARKCPRTMSFQKMKGRNDLTTNDVFIILTSLAPAVYAKLNVIAQWLDLPTIIDQHYQGLIDQAAGRNTGFRQQPNTKTVVVCSDRLWKQVVSKLHQNHPRILLYRRGIKPW